MKSIIQELWYGNIIPMEHSVEGNVHTKKLIADMDKRRDKLCESLTEAQKILLAEYDNAVNEMYAEIEKGAFVYGFRLGGKFVAKTFDTDI